MGESTAISWADHTFNPWWGCTRVSEACDSCYAEAFAHRLGLGLWGKDGERRHFGDKHWGEPLRWNRRAQEASVRRRVFCASMADVFEPRSDLDGDRDRLFSLIEATPWLDWMLLTKRPEQMVRLAPRRWGDGWPGNVWAGTTVESQPMADLRLPRLLAVPSVVRFVSCEPLLGPVRLAAGLPGLRWVIAGGESGPRCRPLVVDDVRSLRDECVAAGVAFHFKQHGGRTPTAGGCLLDGREWKQFPPSAVTPTA